MLPVPSAVDDSDHVEGVVHALPPPFSPSFSPPLPAGQDVEDSSDEMLEAAVAACPYPVLQIWCTASAFVPS